MTYLETLKLDAEKTIRPLAEIVRKLTGQLAHLRHRLETERGNVAKRETDLESLKAASASYLTQNDFAKFRTRLKRVTEDLAAAKESVALFEADLIPRTEKGLAEARQRLTREFTALYVAARPACETKMAELLDQVIAAHDAFWAVFQDASKTYGVSFHNNEPPMVRHARLGEVARRHTGNPWLTFTAAPAATSPAAAVLAQSARAESTRTPEVGESATGGGPLPPEATSEAAASPGAAASRARVLLRRFTGDAGDVAPTALDVDPPPDTPPLDLDAADGQGESDADLDAPDGPDAEAEAPPAAGKDIPESAADSA